MEEGKTDTTGNIPVTYEINKNPPTKKKGITIKKRTLKGIALFLIIMVMFLMFLICYRSEYNSFPKTAKKVADATVLVGIFDKNGAFNPRGTGFIVDKRGYILTAKHNFEEISSQRNMSYHELISKEGYIRIKDRHSFWHFVKVNGIKNDSLERKDVVLLKLDQNFNLDLNTVKISDKQEVNSIGLEVGFLGYTRIGQNKEPFLFINKGILSNIDKELEIEEQTDAFYTINAISTAGYSGGPVFLSKNGKLIALIKITSTECFLKDGKEICGKSGIVVVPHIHEVPSIIEDLESS